MPTIGLPIGTRKDQLLFSFIDHVYDKLTNPQYRVERLIVILFTFVYAYCFLIFKYQTITVTLLSISIYLIFKIISDLETSREICQKDRELKEALDNIIFK